MATSNKYNVIFFVKGTVASEDQMHEAAHYGPHVMFRNANFHTVGSGCEPCDAVAGEVPADYKRKFPHAMPYIKWLENKLSRQGMAPKMAEAIHEMGVPLPSDVLGASPVPTGGRPSLELPPPPPFDPSAPAAPRPEATGRLSAAQAAAAKRGEAAWQKQG